MSPAVGGSHIMNGVQKAVAATAVVGGASIINRILSSKDHDDYVAEAFDSVAEATSDHATLYVDHIDREGVDSPHSGHGGDSVPDIVTVDSQTANAIVEVETATSIQESASHVVEQLVDFGEHGDGKRLLLAVPDLDDQAVEDAAMDVALTAEEQMDSGHEITIVTPENVGDEL